MTIKDKIVQLFNKHQDLSVKEIVDELMVSKQAVHNALNQLLEDQRVMKFGKTPKTIYRLAPQLKPINEKYKLIDVSNEDTKILNENFFIINEIGEILEGISAFEHWCDTRKQPANKTLVEYIKTLKKYLQYKNEIGVIDGLKKLNNTTEYDKIHLDDLYYIDFYAIERFEKTRLGTLLHYAKQGQNKMLMKKIVQEIQTTINKFINEYHFDAIGFVPPTIRREVQIMKFLENHLKINLPKVDILKISGPIPVPQKSLNKLKARILNARNTFTVSETKSYKKLLLIDDAVGSGATLNEIASKIKNKGVASSVTGLAIVGSYKGFDVITDV